MKKIIKHKEFMVIIVSILLSLTIGLLTKDILLGGSTLLTSFLCAYYAGVGKKINYIFGFINYILMGYISYKNNLYGFVVFNFLIFVPLQVKGYLDWHNNQNDNKSVIVREFNLRNGIIITLSCIVGSFMVGYLLSLIPTQNLPFFDSSSNCINLCGIILMVLRFKEAWWIWLVNNSIDLIIWIFMVVHHGFSSLAMLFVSISYLLINVWGIYRWTKEAKNNSNKKLK